MANLQGPQGAGGVNVMTWGRPLSPDVAQQVIFANHLLQVLNHAQPQIIPPIPTGFPNRGLASYTVYQVPSQVHFNVPKPLPPGIHVFNQAYAPRPGYSGRPQGYPHIPRGYQPAPLAPGYTGQQWCQVQSQPHGSYSPRGASVAPWKQPQVQLQQAYPAATYSSSGSSADYKESLKEAGNPDAKDVPEEKKAKKGLGGRIKGLFQKKSKEPKAREKSGAEAVPKKIVLETVTDGSRSGRAENLYSDSPTGKPDQEAGDRETKTAKKKAPPPKPAPYGKSRAEARKSGNNKPETEPAATQNQAGKKELTTESASKVQSGPSVPPPPPPPPVSAIRVDSDLVNQSEVSQSESGNSKTTPCRDKAPTSTREKEGASAYGENAADKEPIYTEPEPVKRKPNKPAPYRGKGSGGKVKADEIRSGSSIYQAPKANPSEVEGSAYDLPRNIPEAGPGEYQQIGPRDASNPYTAIKTGTEKKVSLRDRSLPPLPPEAKEHLIRESSKTIDKSSGIYETIDKSSGTYETIETIDRSSGIYETIDGDREDEGIYEPVSPQPLIPPKFEKAFKALETKAQKLADDLKKYEQLLGRYTAKGDEARKVIAQGQASNKKSVVKAVAVYAGMEKGLKQATSAMAARSTELLVLKGRLEAVVGTEVDRYPDWFTALEENVSKFQELHEVVDGHMFKLDQTRLLKSGPREVARLLKSNSELMQAVRKIIQ